MSAEPWSSIPRGWADAAILTLRPAGAKAETCPRAFSPFGNLGILTDGFLLMTAIPLQADMVITSITFWSGTTAGSGLANQLFGLYDRDRNLLRQTSNGTTGAWAANAKKTLNLTSTFTITYTGLHYLGIMVDATTVPSVVGPGMITNLSGEAPIICGTSNSGLTTTLGANPAAALTAINHRPYAYVS